MTLEGARILLRPAQPDDAETIARILSEPEVARWWGRYDAARVREELDGTLAIVASDEVVGWLMVEEETDPEFPSVSFDIGVTTRLRGAGYGREALRVAIAHFIERGHHRFTIDPSADNERAIRAYAAVGFKPVGVLRAYWRGPDGQFHDGLLMDLLAAEFRPA